MFKHAVDTVNTGLLKDREKTATYVFSEPNSQIQSLEKWSSKRSGTWQSILTTVLLGPFYTSAQNAAFGTPHKTRANADRTFK
jgi:hypothetical protein